MPDLRPHDHAIVRDAARVERAIEPRSPRARQPGVSPLERDETGAGRRQDLGDQCVVVRMQLEQRLGKEEQRRVGRQSERFAVDSRGSRGPRVTRPEARQPNETLAVVHVGAIGLHGAGGEHRVDRGEPAGHRMSPPGELARREAQRRERKSRGVHAELGIDDDVRCGRLDLRRDRGRKLGAVLDEAIGPRA